MPIINIYSPQPKAPEGILEELSNKVLDVLQLPPNHAWVLWHYIKAENAFKPGWEEQKAAPIVIIYCKKSYSNKKIAQVMHIVRDTLSERFLGNPDDVFILVHRVLPHHLLARGSIWEG